MVGNKAGKVGKYVALLLGLGITMFPYLYMLIQSFAPWDKVDRVLIPVSLTMRSYKYLFGTHGLELPWLRAFFNSIIVSTSSAFLMVFTAALAGYALSKLRFKGRSLINNFILFHMFFPSIMILVPAFLIIRSMGLYNTYGAMILPKAVSAWAIFMYVSFFQTIPQEMIDAARVDGASEFKIILKIILPMSKSITTVIFLFLFMARWEELLWDLVVVSDYSMMTLNVLIATMQGPYAQYPGALYAAATLLSFPLLLVFLVFSRNFSKGFGLTLK